MTKRTDAKQKRTRAFVKHDWDLDGSKIGSRGPKSKGGR